MRPVFAAASLAVIACSGAALAQGRPPQAPPTATAAAPDPAPPPAAYPPPQGYPAPQGYPPQGYPPQGYVQPGYPPQGYAQPYPYPPGYAPYPYPYPMTEKEQKKLQKKMQKDAELAYPGEERVLKNPGLLYGGIALGSVGVVGLFTGLMFVLVGGTDCAIGACDQGKVDGGFAVMLGGVVLLGAGIPMIIIGAKRVPKHQVEGLGAATTARRPRLEPFANARGVGFAF